jgi:hypothetical protein
VFHLSDLQVRCVRADLATRVDFQPNSPSLIFYPYKQRAALAGWIADERAATFVVVSHDGSPQVLEGYRLKEPEQIRREKLEREGLADEQIGERFCRWSMFDHSDIEMSAKAFHAMMGLLEFSAVGAVAASLAGCSRLLHQLADVHGNPLCTAGKAKALQMSLSVGKTNLLLRNLLKSPILELEASKLNLGTMRSLCIVGLLGQT